MRAAQTPSDAHGPAGPRAPDAHRRAGGTPPLPPLGACARRPAQWRRDSIAGAMATSRRVRRFGTGWLRAARRRRRRLVDHPVARAELRAVCQKVALCAALFPGHAQRDRLRKERQVEHAADGAAPARAAACSHAAQAFLPGSTTASRHARSPPAPVSFRREICAARRRQAGMPAVLPYLWHEHSRVRAARSTHLTPLPSLRPRTWQGARRAALGCAAAPRAARTDPLPQCTMPGRLRWPAAMSAMPQARDSGASIRRTGTNAGLAWGSGATVAPRCAGAAAPRARPFAGHGGGSACLHISLSCL